MKIACVALLAVLAVCAPLSAMADIWGDQINDPTRFVVLPGYGGAAVLDQETGLVWEQSPSTVAGVAVTQTWLNAQIFCNQKPVGNRNGWRLPTIQELASLVDPTVPAPGPTLPAGHPFSNVQSAGYWSASTRAVDTSGAWAVGFFGGGIVGFGVKTGTLFVWCVRGGHGVDPQ